MGDLADILFMKKIVRFIAWKLINIYFKIRSSWPVWFFLLNRDARRLLQTHPPKLTEIQKRIVQDLNENGIAITHIDELFPEKNLLSEFKAYTERRIEEKTKADTMRRQNDKPFLTYLFDSPLVETANPFARVVMEKTVRDIVNSYFCMCAKFYYMTLNITHPVDRDSQAMVSQRWHRDPEDRKMCKIFLYVNDVDEESGPFIYILKSRYGLKWGSLFPQHPPIGSYPDQQQVDRLVPKIDIKINTGRAGTILFCDTSGLHKGGYAISHPRIMFTAGFRSSASVTHQQIILSNDTRHMVEQNNADHMLAYSLQPNNVSSRTRYLFGFFRHWHSIYRGNFYD